MIVLEKQDILNLIKKKLIIHYPTLIGEPEVKLSLNMNSGDYNATKGTMTFRQHIISFSFDSDIQRRLTISEVKKMLHDEYLNATIGLEVYVSDVTTLPKDTDYNQAAVLQAKIQYDDSIDLSESYIRALIDVALDNKDRVWFDELVGQLNKIHNAINI